MGQRDAVYRRLFGHHQLLRDLLACVLDPSLLRAGGLPERNLAALLFRLEHRNTIEQIPDLLHTLMNAMKGRGFEELNRSFTAYVQYLVLSRAQPREPVPPAINLQELAMLISEKPGMWARQGEREGRLKGRKEGISEGRKKGIDEGRHEGAATLLDIQLQRRLGTLLTGL